MSFKFTKSIKEQIKEYVGKSETYYKVNNDDINKDFRKFLISLGATGKDFSKFSKGNDIANEFVKDNLNKETPSEKPKKTTKEELALQKKLFSEFFDLRGDDANIPRLREILAELKSFNSQAVDDKITKYNMERIASQTSEEKKAIATISIAYDKLENLLFESQEVRAGRGETFFDVNFSMVNDDKINKIENALSDLTSKSTTRVEYAKALVDFYKLFGQVDTNKYIDRFKPREIKLLTEGLQENVKKYIQEDQDGRLEFKEIPKVDLANTSPSDIKEILVQNKNIPPNEYPKIIESIKKQEKRGDTKETQKSLLNTSIQSWNNYYDLKALPQTTKILILPSESVNYRREHAKYYYHEITVKKAIELDFFVNNCRCGFELL